MFVICPFAFGFLTALQPKVRNPSTRPHAIQFAYCSVVGTWYLVTKLGILASATATALVFVVWCLMYDFIYIFVFCNFSRRHAIKVAKY